MSYSGKRGLSYILGMLLCWSLSSGIGKSQSYDFRHLSVSEGMPHAQISTIVHGNDGFIWFGTMGGGVARFDGTNFKTYSRTHGLRDNIVNALYEDSENNFWVGTDRGGVGVLENGTLNYQFTDSPLDTVTVYNIKESADGRIWFATYGAGFFVFDGDSLEQYTVDDGLSSNYVWDFWFRDAGTVWIGTHYGLTILNEASASEGVNSQTITDTEMLGGYVIYDFLEASDGKLWFATNAGITKYQNDRFEPLATLKNDSLGFTYSLIEDRHGNVWIGTAENGIYRQFGGDEFYRVSADNGLSSNLVYTLYKDREQRIWVGTNEDGANLYRGDTFVQFNSAPGFESWPVLAVKHTPQGDLLIGTDGHGLWRATSSDSDFEQEQLAFNGKQVWITEILPNGHFLLLMGDNTIIEYTGREKINYNAKIGLQPVPYTVDLFVDSDGDVWVGTNEGLYRVQGDSLKHYTEADGLADDFIWEITEINEQIWISTNEGLSIFRNDSLKNFTTADGLVHDVISTTVTGPDNGIWLGTSGGISAMERNSMGQVGFNNFDRDSGLQNVDTQVLQADRNGFLWQGTNGGLQRLDITHYQKTDSLRVGHYRLGENGSSLEFAHKAVDTDAAGNIWFGTTSGLLRYNPRKVRRAEGGPESVIDNFTINFQQEVNPDRLNDYQEIRYDSTRKRIELAYDDNNLRFNFGAIEFLYPEDVVYRYRLKGFSDRWNEAEDVNSATFTNLKANAYVFEVQAKGKGGYWGSTASLSLVIPPPFWNTYWFYLLMLLLALAVGYVIIRSRVHYLEKSRLESLVDEQTAELTDALQEKEVLIKEIHHRVKNNLAVISGLLELQLDYSDSDHINKVLKESQRRVLSISMIHEKLYQNENLSEIDFRKYVYELADIIKYSFSHMDKNIKMNVTVGCDIDLSIDQGIPCGLILNELVSNAYEHAFEGREQGVVDITFNREEGTVIFVVSDNGSGYEGYETGASRDSLGVTLVETLVHQLDGSLDVNASDGGTTFTIRFSSENSSYSGFL